MLGAAGRPQAPQHLPAPCTGLSRLLNVWSAVGRVPGVFRSTWAPATGSLGGLYPNRCMSPRFLWREGPERPLGGLVCTAEIRVLGQKAARAGRKHVSSRAHQGSCRPTCPSCRAQTYLCPTALVGGTCPTQSTGRASQTRVSAPSSALTDGNPRSPIFLCHRQGCGPDGVCGASRIHGGHSACWNPSPRGRTPSGRVNQGHFGVELNAEQGLPWRIRHPWLSLVMRVGRWSRVCSCPDPVPAGARSHKQPVSPAAGRARCRTPAWLRVFCLSRPGLPGPVGCSRGCTIAQPDPYSTVPLCPRGMRRVGSPAPGAVGDTPCGAAEGEAEGAFRRSLPSGGVRQPLPCCGQQPARLLLTPQLPAGVFLRFPSLLGRQGETVEGKN